MIPAEETRPSRPSPVMVAGPSRTTRRARVDDDDESEESSLPQSNRQRVHSPTAQTHEAIHEFMPIPEDHGVPQHGSDDDSQASGREPSNAPPEGPAPSPHYHGVVLTFDILPLPARHGPGAAPLPPPTVNGSGPSMNFVFTLPGGGHGPAPQPGAAPTTGNNCPTFSKMMYSDCCVARRRHCCRARR